MEKIIVVPHTHWDREWYLPHERYRYFMVHLVDEVLALLDEDQNYQHFLLDGQVVILEDYLEIKPEEEGRLMDGISSGRVGTGPWYTMPDEFLVSGEALVRNLMLGHRLGNRLGGVMKVGYLPDPFGHVSQLPQILRGFGIEAACMSRGVDWPQSEFWWESPDGSRVLTHWFSLGYANALRLTEDPQAFRYREYEGLKDVLDHLAEKATAGVLLLMNGNDHLGPQPGIPKIIKQLSAKMELDISQGSLVDFFASLRKAKPRLLTYSGEMRSARHFPLLPGVASSRMYLKQRNSRIQTLLEGYAEPVATFAWALGEKYPQGFLRQAWKLLLQNHFHDSICASSVDQVHREMTIRFDRAEQIAEAIVEESMGNLGRNVVSEGDQKGILVFNPTSQRRTETVELWVAVRSIRHGPGGEILAENRLPDENFAILDPEGKAISYQISERKMAPGDILQGEVIVESWRVAFLVQDLPAYGCRFYPLVPIDQGSPAAGTLLVGENEMENEFFRVKVQGDGSLEVLDKACNFTYSSWGYFQDSGDSGDEYNYNPPDHQEILVSTDQEASISILEDEPDWATIRVSRFWELPAGLEESRRARSEGRVACEMITDITLQRGVRRIDFHVTVHNRAKDHRLRVAFPSGMKVSESIAQTAFADVRRLIELPEGSDWAEVPSPTHPTGGYVVVEGEGRGLAVFGKGLPEYEVTEDGTIFLTLLRCIGWLSRADLTARPSNAGPPFETPEAQCLGKHSFEFAAMPFEGAWIEDGNFLQAQQFDLPLIATDIQAGKPLEQDPQMFRVEPEQLVVSAIKRAEDENALVVRFFNISSQALEGKVWVPFEVSRAYEVNLLEEEGEPLEVDSSEIRFSVRGAEIKTLKIYLASSETM